MIGMGFVEPEPVTVALDQGRSTKPATIAVTAEEGGEWIPWSAMDWERVKYRLRTVHSIKFADGSIWDAVNGWRDKS